MPIIRAFCRVLPETAVAGWTMTWVTFLTQQPHLFASEKALILGDLETFDVDRGIVDRLWGTARYSRDQTASTPCTFKIRAVSAPSMIMYLREFRRSFA